MFSGYILARPVFITPYFFNKKQLTNNIKSTVSTFSYFKFSLCPKNIWMHPKFFRNIWDLQSFRFQATDNTLYFLRSILLIVLF